MLLAFALKACLVMWVIARRKGAHDDYTAIAGSLDDTVVAQAHEASYRRLRNVYLSVYGLATFGDWIQGGFLYALYAEYGYSMRMIGLIFVAGEEPMTRHEATRHREPPRENTAETHRAAR